MSAYALSNEADRDIETIARATADRWAGHRRRSTSTDCRRPSKLLSQFPQLGRSIEHIRIGYHRVDHGRHAIFYRHHSDAILIIRILHQRMNARDHP